MEDLKKIAPPEPEVTDGKVYDVTRFPGDRPRGEEALLQESVDGEDATQSFEDVGHSSSSTAKGTMSSYLVGVLEGTGQSAVASQTGLNAGGGLGPAKAKIAQQTTPFTSIDFILPLLILGVAVLSWYMLTFKDSAQ